MSHIKWSIFNTTPMQRSVHIYCASNVVITNFIKYIK
jgi:hypothetical protein